MRPSSKYVKGQRTSPDLVDSVGFFLIALGVLFSTWVSLDLRSQNISDLFLYAGGILLLLHYGGLTRRDVPRRSGDMAYLLTVSALVLGGTVLTKKVDSDLTRELNIGVSLIAALVGTTIVMNLAVSSLPRLKILLNLVQVSLAVNGVVAIRDIVFRIPTGPKQLSWNSYLPMAMERAVGLTDHPNMLGLACAAILPTVPFSWRLSSRSAVRIVVVVCGLLGLAALALSGSRGGALGVMAGVLIPPLFSTSSREKKRAVRLVIGSIASSSMIWFYFPSSALIDRLRGGQDALVSNSAREQGISHALADLRSSFPVGTGMANVPLVHLGILALLVGGGLLVTIGVALWFHRMARWLNGLRSYENADFQLVRAAGLASLTGFVFYHATSPFMYQRYALVPMVVSATLLFNSRRRLLADQTFESNDQCDVVEV